MESTTHYTEALPADLELRRVHAQLEVAERNCLPGIEAFRRQLHDLTRNGETFRNRDRRVY